MTVPQSSLLSRVALTSMDLVVRLWPESSRRWGQAVLAEMGEISEPRAALSWAAGGILLFIRAVVEHIFEWISLPAGKGFPNAALPAGGSGRQFPKHSRLATAAVLLATAVLFFLPIGREATVTVKASWRGYVASDSDRRNLEKRAAQAEKEKDAREFAFVALSYPDPGRAAQFADRAVALDPELVWIYACRSRYQGGEDWTNSAGWLKRLKASDPDNAFVYLVSAYAAGEPGIEKIETKHGGTGQAIGAAETADGEWAAEMDRAFRAPNYDNYFERHKELAREGWKKTTGLSPGLVAIGLWSRTMPDPVQIRAHADLRVSQALREGAAGNVKEAETSLGELTRLGKRITAVGATPFEQAIGLGLTRRGLEGFEKLYLTNGQTNEASEIEAQLQAMETDTNERAHSYLGWRSQIVSGFRWRAVAVQASAISSLMLAVAIALSLLALEAGAASGWRRSGVGRSIACRVADYGPVLFLAASAVFLWSFQPIAKIFEQYRSAGQSNTETMGLFWQLFVLGDANPLLYFYKPYHQWLVGTIVLTAIALIVLLRGLTRQKPVPKIQWKSGRRRRRAEAN